MLKKVGIVFALLIVGLLVAAAMQPDDFRYVRSTSVKASADVVYAQVIDFHRWEQWSPWAKLDPKQKVTFSGPAFGIGAMYEWAGNDQVGEGKMTITDAKQPEFVKLKLDFFKPMQAENQVEFTFKEASNSTTVAWTMTGKNHFISKIAGLFINMEELLGKDFDRGLADIARISQAEQQKADAAKAAAADGATVNAANAANGAGAVAPAGNGLQVETAKPE